MILKRLLLKEEIVNRLNKAIALGGDIPKIAVMPENAQDVLILLEATLEIRNQNTNRPIITMAMAGQGVISRFTGEVVWLSNYIWSG